MCGWVPSAWQVSLSVSVGWGDTAFYTTVGAVERGTIQWEVPSVLGFRVESRLVLHVSLPAFLSHLVPRFGVTCPSRFVLGPCGAARCGEECTHVLEHLWCPGERTLSREQSSLRGIESGSLSSKDNLFPCDPSRPFPPSSHPSTSLALSVVAPIVLNGAFPVNRCPFRVRLIRHVSWRASHPRAPWPPTRPRGVSHATPLWGCYVIVRDPSPAHAGSPVTTDRGFPPQHQERNIARKAFESRLLYRELPEILIWFGVGTANRWR